MKLTAAVAAVALLVGAAAAEARPLRILSLDQCADQYVLALKPEAELALSPRADDSDSRLRDLAGGRLKVRPTLEAALSFQPDVVVRYWGGDVRLLAALRNRGVKVVEIPDARDFASVASAIRQVAESLDAVPAGEVLAHRLETNPPTEHRGEAVYLTSGGYTAGEGTLVDAILRAAGYRNGIRASGYQPLSVEKIALDPPARFVLGFCDLIRGDWRGAGRHPVVQGIARERMAGRLPADTLTCPAWFAADAADLLREGAE